MNINEFSIKIKLCLEELLEPGGKVQVNSMWKNNGIRLLGLCIMQEGKNVAPTFYLEEYYERFRKGEELDTLAKEICRLNEKYQIEHSIDMDFFLDFEKAKEHIVYKLINKKLNKDLLKRVPYVDYMDLAIVFYYLLDHEAFGTGTILIHTKHLELWKKEKDEIYQIAIENTPELLPTKLVKMKNLLIELAGSKMQRELLEEEFSDCNLPMYVLTNQRNTDGAAVIIYPNCLEKIGEEMGSGFYIIPSSVHELIIVPEDSASGDEQILNEMVREVNATQLDPKEVLSDHVYYYDKVQKKFKICSK